MSLVLALTDSNYLTTDFTEINSLDIGSFKSFSSIKGPYDEANPRDRPHRLHKNVLRKINFKENARKEFWICADSFRQAKDGKIYAQGLVYQLNKKNKNLPESMTRLHGNLSVEVKYLFYKNDFLYKKATDKTDQRGRPLDEYYLIRGVM